VIVNRYPSKTLLWISTYDMNPQLVIL